MSGNMYHAGYENSGSYTPDNLIIGGFQTLTKSVTLKAGAVYERGSVLQEGTSGDVGKFLKVTNDPSAIYILAEEVDATSADKVGVVYMTGGFNSRSLFLGAGATLAGVTKALEAKNIYITTAVA